METITLPPEIIKALKYIKDVDVIMILDAISRLTELPGAYTKFTAMEAEKTGELLGVIQSMAVLLKEAEVKL